MAMSHTKNSFVLVQNIYDIVADLQHALITKALTQYIPSKGDECGPVPDIAKLPKDEKWRWRRYQMQLCCLCLWNRAGDTVVSLVSESTSKRPILWIHSNGQTKTTSRAVGHIRNILLDVIAVLNVYPVLTSRWIETLTIQGLGRGIWE